VRVLTIEKQALGWKSIREVRLEMVQLALGAANDGLLADYERRLNEKEVRQVRLSGGFIWESKQAFYYAHFFNIN
jgi:hypothetical protein